MPTFRDMVNYSAMRQKALEDEEKRREEMARQSAIARAQQQAQETARQRAAAALARQASRNAANYAEAVRRDEPLQAAVANYRTNYSQTGNRPLEDYIAQRYQQHRDEQMPVTRRTTVADLQREWQQDPEAQRRAFRAGQLTPEPRKLEDAPITRARQIKEQMDRKQAAAALVGLSLKDRRAYQNDTVLQNAIKAQKNNPYSWITQGQDERARLIEERTAAYLKPRTMKTVGDIKKEWDTDDTLRQNAIRNAMAQGKRDLEERRAASTEGLRAVDRAAAEEEKTAAERDRLAESGRKLHEKTLEAAKYAAGELGITWTDPEELLKNEEILRHPDVQLAQFDEGSTLQQRDYWQRQTEEKAENVKAAEANPAIFSAEAAKRSRYKSLGRDPLVNVLGMDTYKLKTQKKQIQAAKEAGIYNPVMQQTADEVITELDRRIAMKEDPARAVQDIDTEIAFLEGLSGGYWDDKSKETSQRLTRLRRQRAILEAEQLSGSDDYKAGILRGKRIYGEGAGDVLQAAIDSDADDLSHDERGYITEAVTEQHIAEGSMSRNDIEKINRINTMNRDERDRFYYLLGTGRETEAEAYLDAIKSFQGERQAALQDEVTAVAAEAMPVTSAVGSMIMETTKPATTLITIVDNVILGNEYDAGNRASLPTRIQQKVRTTQKEKLRGWAQEKGMNPDIFSTAYDVVMQVGDNLTRAYASAAMGITNPAVTTASMAVGAAGDTIRDLLDRGVDPERAALVGGIAAVAEYVTEKWSDAKLFKNIEEGFGGLKNMAKSMLESAAMESWTEVASDVIQLVGENAVMGDESAYSEKVSDYYYYTGDMEQARKLAFEDQVGEELYTLMLSGLSGGLMDAGSRVISTDWGAWRERKKAELQHLTEQADAADGSHNTAEAAAAAAETAADPTGDPDLEAALAAAAAPVPEARPVITRRDTLPDTREIPEQPHTQPEVDPAIRRRAELMAEQQILKEYGADTLRGDAALDAAIARYKESLINQYEYQLAQEKRAQAETYDQREIPIPPHWAAEQDRQAAPAAQPEQAAAYEQREIPEQPHTQQAQAPQQAPAQQPEQAAAYEQREIPEQPHTDTSVAARIRNVPELEVRHLENAARPGVAETWRAMGLDDADLSDDEAARGAQLAVIRTTMHDDSADGIQDVREWRDVAEDAFDEILDRFGPDLGDARSKAVYHRGTQQAGIQRADGSEILLEELNDPNIYLLQPTERVAIVAAAKTEYQRRQRAKHKIAQAEARKYGFRAAEAWDSDSAGSGQGVRLRTVEGELNPAQVTQLRLLDTFNRELRGRGLPGIDVDVYDTIQEGGSKLNGSYKDDGSTKTAAVISVALDAEGDDILRAAGHEMYHMVKAWSDSAAGHLSDYVLKTLSETEGYDLEERRAELREQYGPDADVDAEIVADSLFDVLGTEERITAMLKDRPGIGERLKAFASKIWESLKAAGRRIAALGSKEARALADQVDKLTNIRELFDRGITESQEAIKAARLAEEAGGYGVDAVAEAQTQAEKEKALDKVAEQLILKTQGETADVNAEHMAELKESFNAAMSDYARGTHSIDAALARHQLKGLVARDARRVAAWYAREAARQEQLKKSRKTIQEEFEEVWHEDDPDYTEAKDDAELIAMAMEDPSTPRTFNEHLLDTMYQMNAQQGRKGAWRDGLDAFVDELVEESQVKKPKIKAMLSLLYEAIDNENKVFAPAAARYADRIVSEILRGHGAADMVSATSEYEDQIYRALRGTTFRMKDVLGKKALRDQHGKNGYYKRTRYSYAEVSAYGDSMSQLNKAFGGRVNFRLDQGLTPSELLADNHDLRAAIGVEEGEAYNESDLLAKILDWVNAYAKKKANPVMYDEERAKTLTAGKAERIILHYFDLPGVYDEASKVVAAYKAQAEQRYKDLAAETATLKHLVDVQGGIITEMGKDTAKAERLRELAEKRAERLRGSVETQKARGLVERQLRTMRQWLFAPTKTEGKHVSENFRSGLATALAMVDTSSARNPDSIRSFDFNHMITSIQEEFGDPLDSGNTSLIVDPDLIPTLQQLADKTRGKMLMEMDGKELTDLAQCLGSIIKMCRDADRARTAAIKARISGISDGIISGLMSQKSKKLKPGAIQGVENFINYSMMDPQRYTDMLVRRAGSSAEVIWQLLRKEGLDTQIRLTEEAKQRFEQAVGQYSYKDWAGGRNQRAVTFDLSSGEQITLTDGQIMSLYLLSKRDQAQRHIYGQGIAAGRVEVRGKIIKSDRPVQVTEADVRTIISALSSDQIAAADALQQIVGGWCSTLGNETSMALYGYKKFKETSYFPIKTLSDQHGTSGTELEQNRKAESLYAITNKGFTKELNQHATNAIELQNAFDVALDHVAGMIAYRAWACPMTDVTRILNYKTEATTVIRELNRTMGQDGANYLIQLLRNINGLNKDSIEGKAKTFTSAFRNFKAAAVGWNISTVLKQGLSIVRAFDVIPMHYFLTGKQLTERFQRDGEGRKVDQLMEKYAPIYAWKQDGRFTMDTGKDLKSIMLPDTEKALNRFTELGMAAAGAADNMTWRSIWLAAEQMIERTGNYQKGSEAYYQAVGDKFTECIDKTQVVDSILHRTEVMRSNSMWVKMGTSFMGEPLKTWNQMVDAIRQFKETPNAVTSKRLAKTGIIMLSSAVLQAVVASIISGFRHWSDEEPLEETIKKYLLGDYSKEGMTDYQKVIEFLFGNNLANELNPISYIPFARDLSDVIQGYDVTRDDMQTITNVIKASQNLIEGKGKGSTAKKITDLAGSIGDMLGVPTSNIFKEVNYISNWCSRALEQAGINTLGIQYINMRYNKAVGNSGNLSEYASFLKRIQDAADDGDVPQAWVDSVRQDLIDAGTDPEKLDTKVAKLQLGQYTEGTNQGDYMQALMEAIRDGDKDAEADIRKQLTAMGKADRIADGIKDALATEPDIIQAGKDRQAGNTAAYQAAVDRYERMGFERDTVIKAINKAINAESKAQKAATPQPAAATPAAPATTYGSSYGYSYSDLSSALLSGSDAGEILKDLRTQGKTDQNIRTQMTKHCKAQYQSWMASADPKDHQRAADLKRTLIGLGIGYTDKTIDAWTK